MKLSLHNAYRDVHFWKLSDGADFEKEARAAEMRSRPHYEVGPRVVDVYRISYIMHIDLF